MGLRATATALIALCFVGLASHAVVGAGHLGLRGRSAEETRPEPTPSLAETDSFASPPNTNAAPTPKKSAVKPAAGSAKSPAQKDSAAARKQAHNKRDAHTPLSPGRDPTPAAPNANGQASGSEVMDEDFVKRESNPENFRPWNGKVKIPSAADEAFEKELALMTKGDSVGKQQEEQNSVQLRQQRIANDNIKYLRSISTIAQKRIARLTELAKEMEAARVQGFEKNKEIVQNAAQYSTEDQKQRLERLKKEGDEKLQREKNALTRKSEISALDEEENRDELEAKMNNLLPVDYKFTPQSEKVASNGGTDIAAVPDKTAVSPKALQAAKAAKAAKAKAKATPASTPSVTATAGATASATAGATASATAGATAQKTTSATAQTTPSATAQTTTPSAPSGSSSKSATPAPASASNANASTQQPAGTVAKPVAATSSASPAPTAQPQPTPTAAPVKKL